MNHPNDQLSLAIGRVIRAWAALEHAIIELPQIVEKATHIRKVRAEFGFADPFDLDEPVIATIADLNQKLENCERWLRAIGAEPQLLARWKEMGAHASNLYEERNIMAHGVPAPNHAGAFIFQSHKATAKHQRLVERAYARVSTEGKKTHWVTLSRLSSVIPGEVRTIDDILQVAEDTKSSYSELQAILASAISLALPPVTRRAEPTGLA